jgi:HTH-type transcriptional regulator/antitoxin HigA
MSTTYNETVPHPGHFIREELEARGWTQRDLAFILGVPEQSVNQIIVGKRGISSEMAKALAASFAVSPEFFVNLQNAYDLSRAREPDPSVKRRACLQSSYPVREMIRRGWLEDTDAAMLELQMARFFEGSDYNDIPHMPHAAKKTRYNDVPPTQLAWLFRVRQISRSVEASPYSAKALKEALGRLRRLTLDPEEAQHVPRILKECGVRFIVVESLPRAKIDGVCFWLDKSSPVIGMSLRFDRIDNFWFVLRHEMEHVLCKHGQTGEMIDAELEGERAGTGPHVPEAERVANSAASDFCVPTTEMESFIAGKSPFFSERDVLAFAGRIGVHPALVVGQIRNHLQRWDYLNRYLTKIRSFVIARAIVDGWGQVFPIAASDQSHDHNATDAPSGRPTECSTSPRR